MRSRDPGLFDQARRRRDAEARGEASALVEEEGPAGAAASGRAAGRPAARSSRGVHGPAPRRLSAARLPSTNSRSRARAVRSSGFTRVPAAAINTPPSGVRMSRATVMAGSQRRLRSSRRRRDAGHRLRFLQPLPPATLARASCSSRASSPERFHLDEPRLDLRPAGRARRPARSRRARRGPSAEAGAASVSASAMTGTAKGRIGGRRDGKPCHGAPPAIGACPGPRSGGGLPAGYGRTVAGPVT